MNNYMGSIAMGFDFNDLNQATGTDTMDQSTTSPTSHTPHDSSTHRSHSQGNVTVYQTTGPDAHTSPIQAPGGSGQPALNPRSCVTCRKRKVRCDKQMPCSNCRRAQIPCVFPAPGRAPRQPRPKDPNAPPKNSSQRELELMKRLKKLEGIVEELSGQIEVESGGRNPSSAGSPDESFGQLQSGERSASIAQRQMSNTSIVGTNMQSPAASDSMSDRSEAARRKDLQQQFGRLVMNDHNGSKRYVSSGFWAKINDTLDSIREETQRLTDEGTDESDNEITPNRLPLTAPKVDHHSFILGYRSSDVDLRQCHPVAAHIPFLWSVYQENVEPLIKVLHTPSMEAIFRDARKNSEKLSPGHQALVFAIYYAAVTSLEPEEVETNLGAKKEDLLTQYRFAVEQALSKANFLNASDLSVIQAFTIFLVIVRRHDESRFCWSLIGLLVHLAQGMGLHRDGSHFGLTPFETEMRRRLWWALLVLDLRSAEELGTDLIISEVAFDTQMPSNINDADISPTTTEFPEPREGRSDTATCLVRYEICSLARRLVRASSAAVTMCPKAGAMTLADRERTLLDVYRRVETKFLKQQLSDTEPLYWMAAVVARVIMAKMCLVIYQPMLFPGSEYQLSDDIRQRIYVSAIEIIEYSHILNKDHRCRQFRWLFLTYTNWHAIAYTLVETCQRPWTALVERGWEALNGYERDPVEYAKSANHTAVFLPLRKLFIRARRHRAAELIRLRANTEEAQRLDLEERMNPAQTRFGPVPGTEHKMDQVRERWRALVGINEDSMPPLSRPGPSASASAPSVSSEPNFSQPFTSQPDPQQLRQPQGTRTPSGKDLPSDIDLSDAAMNMMDDLMNQGNAFPITALWPLPLNDLSNQINTSGASPAVGATGMVPLDPGQMVQPDALRQQALTLQTQPAKDDHLPPYLWSDPFTSMNTKFDDIGGEDTDMLGDEFNWQDWSQNIRGLEMEATQAQNRW